MYMVAIAANESANMIKYLCFIKRCALHDILSEGMKFTVSLAV